MGIMDYVGKINDVLIGPEKRISVEGVRRTSGVYLKEYLPTVPSGYIVPPLSKRPVRDIEVVLDIEGALEKIETIELVDDVYQGTGVGWISTDETRVLQYLQSVGKKLPIRVKSPSTETLKNLVKLERQNKIK